MTSSARTSCGCRAASGSLSPWSCWLLVGFGPTVWERFEGFKPGSDYRLPYELSSDYWLYGRYCGQACEQSKILVVGDSVIWGHYVPPDQTLAHYLNEFSGTGATSPISAWTARIPAALEGLLPLLRPGLSGRTVVLHFNPLWLSSPKHDLQTDKEFHFNHPELVSQFAVKIPCYKASIAQRLRIVAATHDPVRQLDRAPAHHLLPGQGPPDLDARSIPTTAR